MLERIKNYFGIEGVKIDLVLPEQVREKEGIVEGTARFSSMHTQLVRGVRVSLIEKYFRGRGDERLVDEYEVNAIFIDKSFEVAAGETVELDFKLPFKFVKSEIDEWESRNLFTGGLAKLAKLAYNVKSIYKVVAEADVKGTALNPFDEKEIRIR